MAIRGAGALKVTASQDKPKVVGRALLDETRKYAIEEADLAEWVSGGEHRFHVTAIEWDNAANAFVITLSSAKQAELPRITQRGAPLAKGRMGPIERTEPTATGPSITDADELTSGDDPDVPSQVAERLQGR